MNANYPRNEVLHSDSVSRLVALLEMLCEVVIFHHCLSCYAVRKTFIGNVQTKMRLLAQALWGEEKERQRHVSADLGVFMC